MMKKYDGYFLEGEYYYDPTENCYISIEEEMPCEESPEEIEEQYQQYLKLEAERKAKGIEYDYTDF